MIETVYRSFILVGSLLLVILLSIQLWWSANKAAIKLDQGSTTDTGIFPKRSRNVNAWWNANPTSDPNDPQGNLSLAAYPSKLQGTTDVTKNGHPIRIVIPPTSSCPIFRPQDNGSVDPPLIT